MNYDLILVIIILFIFVILLLGSLLRMLYPTPYYLYSGDEQSCEQMRDSGWSEEEIEEFMDNSRGLYFPPK